MKEMIAWMAMLVGVIGLVTVMNQEPDGRAINVAPTILAAYK